MSYYTRVLSKVAQRISLKDLRKKVADAAPELAIELEQGSEKEWTSLVVRTEHDDVCELTCDLRADPGGVVEEEVEEFREDLREAKPAIAAEWVRKYLSGVNSIYALRILYAEGGPDWEAVSAVQAAILELAPGITQADAEGFSNEDGHHIVWQFPDDASGAWHMAVLNDAGTWVPFEMDLGNKAHREAFWRGEMPKGISPSE